MKENDSSTTIKEIVSNIGGGAIIGGAYFFLILDLLFYHNFDPFEDLFAIFLITSFILFVLLIVQAYKNNYLRLTIQSLISLEEEIGISSYVNVFLSDILASGIFSLRDAYRTLEKQLRTNYIFSVPESDFENAISAILKTGDAYYLVVTKSSIAIMREIRRNISRIRGKIIIHDNIVADGANADFINDLRDSSRIRALTWRKSSKTNIFNIILALEENGRGEYRPIRALKFEVGDQGKTEVEYVISEKEALEYWCKYFIEDWVAIDQNIRKPIGEAGGAAEAMDAILDIYDNYPDLVPWMKEEVCKNKSKGAISRALNNLMKSERYKKDSNLQSICKS
jgi:hypothetical protein